MCHDFCLTQCDTNLSLAFNTMLSSFHQTYSYAVLSETFLALQDFFLTKSSSAQVTCWLVEAKNIVISLLSEPFLLFRLGCFGFYLFN